MKSKLILFLILITIFNNIIAQEYIVTVKKPYSSRHSYLKINSDTQIEDDYFKCLDFTKEGYGIVLSRVRRGYQIINIHGEPIELEVPLKPIINGWSEQTSGFSCGMVITSIKDKFGALNYKGKLTVPRLYTKLGEFNGNHAIGMKGRVYYIVSNKGAETKLKFKKTREIKRFSEGLAAIKIGNVFGYIDTMGQMIIEPKYKTVGHFNGGVAWAKNQYGRVGYINELGEWILEPIFLMGENYDKESGLARVKTSQGWGYIDTNNQFDNLGVTTDFFSFYDGLAINRENGKVGFIDRTGSWVIEPIYEAAHKFKNGFARVRINDKWGIINENGDWLVEPKYDQIGDVVIIRK